MTKLSSNNQLEEGKCAIPNVGNCQIAPKVVDKITTMQP